MLAWKEEVFLKEDMRLGRELLAERSIQNIIFSGGTYQIAVAQALVEGGEVTVYWIFLQLGEERDVIDRFCTCEKAEKRGSCPHLAAGLLSIFRGHRDPLHVRFRDSLWNRLFQLAAKKHGYKTALLEKVEGGYQILSDHGRVSFGLRLKKAAAKERAEEWIEERKAETEETSLKFSNLDPKELERWRKGRPSHELLYELSFWSDFAKWMMILEDQGEKPKITFSEYQGILPKMMTISMKEIEVVFHISEVNWPIIIAALASYKTELPVFEFRDRQIDRIEYDPDQCAFRMISHPASMTQKKGKEDRAVEEPVIEEIVFEDWTFRAGVGFFPNREDPLLMQPVITKEEIPELLSKYPSLLERYLAKVEIHRKPIDASYHLAFDDEYNLHIRCYAFEEGDLEKGRSSFFDPWAYIEGKGFYRLTHLIFKGLEKIIPRDAMPEFIERHRHWLSKYEAFQIHLASIESKVGYEMLEDDLVFINEEALGEGSQEMCDFGAWVYVKSQGFYSRGSPAQQKKVMPGIHVEGDDISAFIHQNQEELEQVKGFFHSDPGLEKTGLMVILDGEGQIVIEPRYYFKKESGELGAQIFGDFIYIPGKGFAEILDTMKIPARYAHPYVIVPEQIPYFLKAELKRIQPYILHMDKRLMQPRTLQLKLKGVERKDKGWLMDFSYISPLGEIKVVEVYEALLRFSPFILSDAGMIVLKDRRFQWLMRMPSSAFDPLTGKLFLSILDWIKLSIFEDIQVGGAEDEPRTPEEEEVFTTLTELQQLHLSEMPDIKGLKSNLRPYQEIGVRWLWFLYSYSLSGFLCDDMGLGKTHQAMALIAAVMNYKKKGERHKFLVVCPTSVAYHWQDLLEKFLPKVSFCLYHGTFRSPKELSKKHDLILTTYGILRSDKELFAKMDFEIAIFDEIQVAKNQRSQIHSTLKQLKVVMKLALTGTPIENRITELKALFDIILPKFLPPAQEFKEEFVIPIEKEGDKLKQQALAALVKPFILRRKKQEVLHDLPEKIEEILHVDPSEEQKKLYEEVVTQSKNLVGEEKSSTFYVHVFALLNKLKQICNHPAMVLDDVDHFERHESGKWELFVELLQEVRGSGQKVVVFSQYLKMLDIIEMHCKREGIGFAGIRGDTRDRKGEIKRFQEDPNCEIFVASLQAAGVGIDLTAASVVIHYDRWWNPAREQQATDRVYRIGQNKGVSVFKLVTKHSVEEHIHQMIERKRALIDNVIGYDSQEELKTLDRKELVLLLKQIHSDVEKQP